jgi:hypothetical protein
LPGVLTAGDWANQRNTGDEMGNDRDSDHSGSADSGKEDDEEGEEGDEDDDDDDDDEGGVEEIEPRGKKKGNEGKRTEKNTERKSTEQHKKTQKKKGGDSEKKGNNSDENAMENNAPEASDDSSDDEEIEEERWDGIDSSEYTFTGRHQKQFHKYLRKLAFDGEFEIGEHALSGQEQEREYSPPHLSPSFLFLSHCPFLFQSPHQRAINFTFLTAFLARRNGTMSRTMALFKQSIFSKLAASGEWFAPMFKPAHVQKELYLRVT